MKTTAAFISAANTVADSFTPSALQQPLVPLTPTGATEANQNSHSHNQSHSILHDFNLNLDFPVDEEYIDFHLLETHLASLQTTDVKREVEEEESTAISEVPVPQIGGTRNAVIDTVQRDTSLQLPKSEFSFLGNCNIYVDSNATNTVNSSYFTDNSRNEYINPGSNHTMAVSHSTGNNNCSASTTYTSDMMSFGSNSGSQSFDRSMHFSSGSATPTLSNPTYTTKKLTKKPEFHIEVSDISDAEPDPDDNMDLSDWLDVIMPSTGIAPLSNNAPVPLGTDVDAYIAEANTNLLNNSSVDLAQDPLNFVDLLNFGEMDFTPSINDTAGWDKIDIATT